MGMIAEVLGLAPLGSSTIPSVYAERQAMARRAGRVLMQVVAANYPLPRDLITRESLENACAAVSATGGSTNATLHIPAIANEVGIPFSIEDVAAVFERTPLITHLSPNGPYLYADLHEVGGVPVVLKQLLKGGYLHGECPTLDGRPLAEVLLDFPDADGVVVMPITEPRTMAGGLSILKGNLAPEGATLSQRRDVYEPQDRSGKGHMVKAGYAQKYIASVGPASHGAVTHAGNLYWPTEGEQ